MYTFILLYSTKRNVQPIEKNSTKFFNWILKRATSVDIIEIIKGNCYIVNETQSRDITKAHRKRPFLVEPRLDDAIKEIKATLSTLPLSFLQHYAMQRSVFITKKNIHDNACEYKVFYTSCY